MTQWPRLGRVCRIGALLPVLALAPAAYAQIDSREGIALQNQLYQLRQDIQLLRSDMARGGGGGGGGGGGEIAAQLLSRVQAMEEQVRQLRGRIDETQNLIARQNADLSKRIDDLTFQLSLPGRSGALQPPAVPPGVPAPPPVREVAPRPVPEPARPPDAPPATRLSLQPTLPLVIPPPPPAPPQTFTFNPSPQPMRETPPPQPEPPRAEVPRSEPPRPEPPRVEAIRPVPRPAAEVTPPPPAPDPVQPVVAVIPPGGKRTPEMALQEGNAALARRDYAAAERAAREVMGNRASPRAYDGQFLLAQALAGQKQFAQAAIAFDDAYNRAHKGRHAQDALIGLAGALTSINERRAACDTLGRMRTEFPQVRADLQDSITKTNDRAGCAR